MASLPFELMYLDFVEMLAAMGVPPSWEQRSEDDPIVIVGGPAVTGNPLPVWLIADAIVLGEVEDLAGDVLDALSKPTRGSRLRSLSEVSGVLVPPLSSGRARRVYTRDLDSSWFPVVQEMPGDVEPVWGRAFMLETSRGCARKCRFCMEGCIFKPRRDRSFARLRELLEAGVQANRVKKVSFYSLSFFDNPAGERILDHAVSLGLETSVPSLRAETLTEKRAELLVEGGQRTVSIAPETGSWVIARAVMKLVGRHGALRAAEILSSAGVKSVKVYLMAGFPGETLEDVRETVEMMLELRETASRHGVRVKASVNPFVPKPSTPLQWFGFKKSRGERAELLARELRKAGIETDLYPLDYAELQTAIGRGGLEVSRAILETAATGGGYRRLLSAIRRSSPHSISDWSPEETPSWHELVEDEFNKPEKLRAELYHYVDTLAGEGRASLDS